MPMAADEYRSILKRLGLRPEDAERLPGITKRLSFRWYREREAIPDDFAAMLRGLVRTDATPDEPTAALTLTETARG